MRNCWCISLVVLLGVCLELPTAKPDSTQSYLPFVESHLRNLTTQGLDAYGPKQTPNWMAIIDTRTGVYPEFDHTPRRVYRKIGAPRGCSFYWDQPMIVAAHRLSEITGNKAYDRAARRYTLEILSNGVDEHGLLLWGNHRYYDAFEDHYVGFSGSYHELRPYTPSWDLLWREDPNAVSRMIRIMADRHMHTPAEGGFNRHDNGKREHAFLEAGAVLVESLAWLYHKTGDPDLLERALRIAEYSFKHRGETTDLLANNPDSNRWDSRVCTTEVGLWANACLAAADYSNEDAFVEMAQRAVAAYLRYGYDPQARQYFGQLRIKDGTPEIPHEKGYWPRKYSLVWNPDQWPTHDYPMALAQACITLSQRTNDQIFEEAVDRWADIICSTERGDRSGACAEQYGLCISFLMRASRERKNDSYLRLARKLADEAVERLYENGWFQGYAGSHLYEAVDGVGHLLLALMDLEARQRGKL